MLYGDASRSLPSRWRVYRAQVLPVDMRGEDQLVRREGLLPSSSSHLFSRGAATTIHAPYVGMDDLREVEVEEGRL
jgi:hypothetical protein